MTSHQPGIAPAFSMNEDKWQKKRDTLKKKFPHLTERDLKYEEGKEDEMLKRLQLKLGKSKEALKKFIDAI